MINKERQQELIEFQEAIGFYFQTNSLLDRALTHKSYVAENGHRVKNNERLEFIGDAVIDLIIRDYSWRRFPERSEGELSKLRSAVASEAALSKIGRRMDLGKYLHLGKGEESSGGRKKRSLLANAFEALAAAIYLDGGFDKAYEILLPILKEDIERVSLGKHHGDFKSKVQEYTQNRLGCVPVYRVIKERGPDHSKTFEVELMVNDEKLGQGRGRSKKTAEQRAAKEALFNLLRMEKQEAEPV